ncbi:MAG: DNA-protecting protein DprA, partial [Burkholderiaceae bacterium]|nr:DNA-protecting protein DprA [Burkholderiaceae bacterium]
AAFGLPQNIFSAARPALGEVAPERIVANIVAAPSPELQDLIARTLAWAAEPGNRIITLADADYPPLLLNIPDPPLLLYAKGNTTLLSQLSVAIVGSRNATAQGIQHAEKFAAALSTSGLHTVSGMALGIDAAAHRGSLTAFEAGRGSGSTIAVVGTGMDIVYPARNRALAHAIARHGCIVSEYALGTPAIASNFSRRNRIVSGLARGTLVVEAAVHSGSLITARTATEQGREVFAIPGSIHSPLAKGCHQLIRQGAKLVESAQDILEELTPFLAQVPAIAQVDAVTQDGHPLLAAMGYDPIDVGTLAQRSGMDLAALNTQLLDLELEGHVEVLPGNTYRRLQ